MSRHMSVRLAIVTGVIVVGATQRWLWPCLATASEATMHYREAEASVEGSNAEFSNAPPPLERAPSADPPAEQKREPRARLNEVIVTARRFKENLQNVPDAITAFTPATIVNAGIEHFGDFAARVPSLNFTSGCAFECEDPVISMRGVGNGQEEWPSVSYIVDGVPASTLDVIESGSLYDIERIEVLRGPQSALYGFNAIAGAINIITKSPTNDWEGDARMLHGNGDDLQGGGDVSGPLIPNKLLFRLDADYQNRHGLIRSQSNGIDLDFSDRKQARLRLLLMPMEALMLDLRASIDREHEGAVYQDRLPLNVSLDDFSGRYAHAASRAFPGVQDRSLDHYAMRVQYDLPGISLISISAFDLTHQSVPSSSLCYDDPNDPQVPLPGGGTKCILFGTAYGMAAAPGMQVDEFYSDENNYSTITEDLRLTSRGNRPVEWTFGTSALHRRALDGFDAGVILAPGYTNKVLFPDWNVRIDNWWGVYGEVIWNASSRWQFTLAARYDKERYANTAYTNRRTTIIVPVPTASGPLNTQHDKVNSFQPKGQISYHFTDSVMGYATVSRGFRAGFFFNGNYTLPESTTNYEVGVKSTFDDRRVLVNGDIFHVDYSNQQTTIFKPVPPFLFSQNIPRTRINGVEVESSLVMSQFVTVSLAMSYLDSRVSNGTESPVTPKLHLSPAADFRYPLSGDWNAMLHLDNTYVSSQYLGKNNANYVGAENLLNARLGIENGQYNIAAFVRNAADRRYALGGGGGLRYQNEPRSYGIEVRAHF